MASGGTRRTWARWRWERFEPSGGRQAGIGIHAEPGQGATHLLQSGYDISTVLELLGHADASTTMVYTHVLNKGGSGILSPLDAL